MDQEEIRELNSEEVWKLTQEETTELLFKAWMGHEKLLIMIDAAWGIIANVDCGEAGTNSPGWRETATRWRDEYKKLLEEETEATAPKAERQFVDGDPVLERMADEVHQVWCGWMEYMFKKGSLMSDNTSWVMSDLPRLRWTRQMKTPYAQLSEQVLDLLQRQLRRLGAAILPTVDGREGHLLADLGLDILPCLHNRRRHEFRPDVLKMGVTSFILTKPSRCLSSLPNRTALPFWHSQRIGTYTVYDISLGTFREASPLGSRR